MCFLISLIIFQSFALALWMWHLLKFLQEHSLDFFKVSAAPWIISSFWVTFLFVFVSCWKLPSTIWCPMVYSYLFVRQFKAAWNRWVQGQPKASLSASVPALLCAAIAHVELPQLFPVHSVSLKNPVLFYFVSVSLEGKPLGICIWGKITYWPVCMSVCPPVSSPPTSSYCLLLHLTFLGTERLWGSAGHVAPGLLLCAVWLKAASLERCQSSVLRQRHFWSLFYCLLSFFRVCVCVYNTYTPPHQSTIILMGF